MGVPPHAEGKLPGRGLLPGREFADWFLEHAQALPLPGEIRVYPNLHPERRNLAGLFLNRGAFGIHAQRQVGKGRDFEKLREYIPGDSYDEIHWKATAKRGHPVTKVFQVERTQEIVVVIDSSRLSAKSYRTTRRRTWEESAPPRGR